MSDFDISRKSFLSNSIFHHYNYSLSHKIHEYTMIANKNKPPYFKSNCMDF